MNPNDIKPTQPEAQTQSENDATLLPVAAHQSTTIVDPNAQTPSQPAAAMPVSPEPEIATAPTSTDPPESEETPQNEPDNKKPAPPPKQLAKLSLPLIITSAVILFLLASGSVVYAYYQSNHKTLYTSSATTKIPHATWAQGSNMTETSTSCSPVPTSNMTESNAITAYTSFVKAIQTKNQTCANSLSSAYFLNQSKTEFGASNGDWITAQPDGIRPIWEDFSQLPTILTSTSFTQGPYTQAAALGQKTTSTGPTTGITLNYPIDLSKYTGNTTQKWEISLSFVDNNGKVLVDNLLVQPQTTDSTTSD